MNMLFKRLEIGIPSIDRCLQQIYGGELILLCERPGMGGTSFLKQVAQQSQSTCYCWSPGWNESVLTMQLKQALVAKPNFILLDGLGPANFKRKALRLLQNVKALIQGTSTAVILKYHLPRHPEKRTPPRPILEDLAPALSKLADKILLLYRPAYYYCDTSEEHTAYFVVAKNNRGPLGEAAVCRCPMDGFYMELFGCKDSADKTCLLCGNEVPF